MESHCLCHRAGSVTEPAISRRWEEEKGLIAHGDKGSLEVKSRWCLACTSVGLLDALASEGESISHPAFSPPPLFPPSTFSRTRAPGRGPQGAAEGLAVDDRAVRLACWMLSSEFKGGCKGEARGARIRARPPQIASRVPIGLVCVPRALASLSKIASLGLAIEDWVRRPILRAARWNAPCR